MAKRMLIDAAHPEETRVVVLSCNRLEEFDFESSTKKQVKGNIYLAKVTRVEPSLQAAFVDYGGNRHGFLAFSEIHPDYYRIPVSDRSGREGEPHEASERAGLNGGEEPGVPLAAALPEPVPVPETAEEVEPTLAAWQEERRAETAHSANGEDADRAAGWDEAHVDHTGSPGSEPESIALRVAEVSVVAAEIAHVPAIGNGAEAEGGSVETLGGDEVE